MFDVDKFIVAVEGRPALYNIHMKEYSNRKLKAEIWSEVAEEMYSDWNDLSPAEKEIRERTLVKKWKALRDNFVRDYKLAVNSETGLPTTKKKYTYFDQLFFLVPHIKPIEANPEMPVVVEYSNEYELGDDVIRKFTPRTNKRRRPNRPNRTNAKSMPAILDDEEKIQFLSKMVFDEDSTSEAPVDVKRSKMAVDEQTIALASENLTKILEESLALRREDRTGNRAFLTSFASIMDALPIHKQMEARLSVAQVFNSLMPFICESPEPYEASADS